MKSVSSLLPRLGIALASLALVATVAEGARVMPKMVTASSNYPPEDGFTYTAQQAIDGKLATSWVEGEDGSGLGAWMKVDFDGEREVTGVKVWGGLWYSYDFWTRANRPKSLEVKFSDGTTEDITFEDKMVAQVVMFKKPHKTTDMRLKITAIYNGTTWLDTAISEVQVIDTSVAGVPDPRAYKFSSKLADDGDGNYNPENMVDGVADSMWCEGNKDGDGLGEWVEVDYGVARSVSKITLVNGVGGNFGAWMKSNRATKATLTFSDGSKAPIELKNSLQPQTITFPARTTSMVRVTFDEIYKGKEYNDMCIAEMYVE
jgi:hypothetical protein